MDFKQFNYILAIAQERNFSKAAKKLFISQPSLSQYVNRIEKQLGVTLFDRSKSPITITYAGQVYIDTIHKILDEIDEMNRKFDGIDELKSGKLSIGITPSKAVHPLPIILPAFKKKYPDIELIITEANNYVIEDSLAEGTLDLGIVNLPIKSKEVKYTEIYSEKILLAAPHNFEPSKLTLGDEYPLIDLKQLENEKFILLRSEQRLRQLVDKYFKKIDFKPEILLETNNIDTSLRLTSTGMGFSFVPESHAKHSTLDNFVQYFEVGTPCISWNTVVAYKGKGYSKATNAFIDIAKEICSK